MKHKNIDMNIKSCQNAYQSYNHLLNEIKNCLRTGNLNRENPLLIMLNIDNISIDNCPPILDTFSNSYDKLFNK